MPDDRLAASLRDGAHALLARTVGRYEGTARTWFEPGVLADTSPVRGTIRALLDGRFVLHEYEGTLVGERMVGAAILGCRLTSRGETWVAAWVDTCHNGTEIMASRAPRADAAAGFSVLGAYDDPTGGPSWGWRTAIALPSPDELVLSHFNIPPGGLEALAVEFRYRRVGPA